MELAVVIKECLAGIQLQEVVEGSRLEVVAVLQAVQAPLVLVAVAVVEDGVLTEVLVVALVDLVELYCAILWQDKTQLSSHLQQVLLFHKI
jgi:hypothetical protein